MMFLRNFRPLLVGLCVCALLTSCETAHDVWLNDMQGMLDYNIPAAIGKGQPVEFTAGGITTPSQGIIYEWQAPGFSPSSGTGQSFAATTPAEPGDYPVTVTVKSTGYHDLSVQRMVIIQSCTVLPGNLDFSIPAQVAIGQSLTFSATGINSTVGPITYIWDAPQFAPATGTGNTFTATTPAIANGYPVSVTASAAGYCDTTKTKLVNVVGGIDMKKGSLLKVVSPATIYQNQETTFLASFTAGGDNPPANDLITYTWECTNFVPGTNETTDNGKQYKFTTPLNAGQCIIKLTASAEGYNSVDTLFSFEPQCKPMPSTPGFNAATRVNINEATTFTATAPNGMSNVSYTWTLPSFSSPTYTEYNRIVSAKAPATEGSVSVTLTISADGYCPATYTQNISVTNCKEMTMLEPLKIFPTEEELAVFDSYKKYEFTAPEVNVNVTGGAPQYKWSFSSTGFSPQSQTGTSRIFSTTAPAYTDGNTYELSLEVTATSYCPQRISRTVNIREFNSSLNGTVEVRVKRPAYTTDWSSSVWLANNKEVVLDAHYIPGTEDVLPNDLIFDWFVGDGVSTPISLGSGGTVTYTPTTGSITTDDSKSIIVKVRAKEKPLSPKLAYIPLTIQYCEYPGHDLFINKEYQCERLLTGNVQAYIIDSTDINKNRYRIVRMPGKSQWWTAENLRKTGGMTYNDEENAKNPKIGIFYEYDEEMSGLTGKYCPKGWRIPSLSEWEGITGLTNPGKAVKSSSTSANSSLTVWDSDDGGSAAAGTDTYGFTAYPTGKFTKSGSNPGYTDAGWYAYFLLSDTNVAKLENSSTSVLDEARGSDYYPIRCVKPTTP